MSLLTGKPPGRQSLLSTGYCSIVQTLLKDRLYTWISPIVLQMRVSSNLKQQEKLHPLLITKEAIKIHGQDCGKYQMIDKEMTVDKERMEEIEVAYTDM